jgi:hypothetical protein
MRKIRMASLEHFEGRPAQPPSDDFLRATTPEGWS